jgi:hypothetical protein
VSGTPPWGPAPKPEGELPWAASPTPIGLGRRPPVHNVPAPASSIWDTAGLGMPGPALEPEAETEADAVGKPIYVWNPSASTETMPAQRRDSDTSGDG